MRSNWRSGGGRRDSRIRVCEVDARVGGAIRIDMRAPDGVVYPMSGRFIEIDPPHRLVFVTAALDGDGRPMFEVLNTVTFTEVRNGERRFHWLQR